MTEKEKNNKLYEEYTKKTYEELDKMEKENNLTEVEAIIISVIKLEKEISKGKVKGIPAEDVFNELLGEIEYKKADI